jgi:putative membrane protein
MQYLEVYNSTGDETALATANQYLSAMSSLPQLASSSQQISAGVTQLTAGMKNVKTSTTQLLVGLQSVQAGFGDEQTSNTIINGSYMLKASLSQLTDNNSTLTTGASQLSAGTQSLQKGVADYTDGASKAYAGSTQLADGASALNSAVPTLSDGVTALNNGASALYNGTSQLSSKIPTLSSGVKALDDGASQLLTGASTLANGSQQVTDGAKELSDGIVTLKDGTASLDDGANQLSDGINTAKDGVNESVADTNEQLKALDGLSEYGSEPVSFTTEYVQPVANYGSAFAPYFMGLSLWVGGLMIFFGIYLDYNKKIKILSKDSKNPILRTVCFAGISALQGILLAIVIKYILGITVNNLGLLFVSCILVSLTFMAIIQFCLVNFGNVGKFLSLLLLILQLTSCAGTFPIETQNGFFQFINKLLPMTYSTQLFKEAISGTASTNAGKNALYLVLYLLVTIAITIVCFLVKQSKTKKIEAVEA